MSKKTEKKEMGMAEVRPANDKPDVVRKPDVDMGALSADRDADRLFALYVARVSTIDCYHIPITDKGLPSAYANAFKEAVVALAVFNRNLSERN